MPRGNRHRLAGYVWHISLAERFIFFCVFFLQIAFAGLWLGGHADADELYPSCGYKPVQRVLAAILVFGVVLQTALLYSDHVRPAFHIVPSFPFVVYRSPNAVQKNLHTYFGKGDVVLSDTASSWSLPVYTGAKIVALSLIHI